MSEVRLTPAQERDLRAIGRSKGEWYWRHVAGQWSPRLSLDGRWASVIVVRALERLGLLEATTLTNAQGHRPAVLTGDGRAWLAAHPLTTTRELCDARHIPVTDAFPALYYIASMCDDDLRPSVPITAHETDIIRSYIEYICVDFYNRKSFEDFVGRWSGQHTPYALIGGHNTVTFLKRADDDWAYRRGSWQQGPLFSPQPRTGHGRKVDLMELLDVMICGHGTVDNPRPDDAWEAWKAARLAVFAAPSALTTQPAF